MIIRAKTFKAWIKANLDRDQIKDLSRHGADSGYYGLTYTSDTVKLYDRFETEIWDALNEAADDQGTTVPAMIATFGRVDMASSGPGFKNLMVWFYAEGLCHKLTWGRD